MKLPQEKGHRKRQCPDICVLNISLAKLLNFSDKKVVLNPKTACS